MLVWFDYIGSNVRAKGNEQLTQGRRGCFENGCTTLLTKFCLKFPNLIFCYCCALHICSKNKVLTSFGTVLFQCLYQKQATSVLEIYFYLEKRLMVRAHLSYLSASVKLLCYELGKLRWLRDHFM